jgi:hypothetical protein
MTDTSQELIEALDARAARRNERREFFRTALGATAIAAAGAAAIGLAESAGAASVTDADILNFALNLEYLEANFYSFAAYGTAISSDSVSGTGTPGAATGGRQVTFTDPVVQAYAREIAANEMAHVTFLRTALGSTAVAQPAIDLSPAGAFTALAKAAGVTSGTFDPYASDENFLLGAFIFEDVGVTAYKGAAPLFTSAVYRQAATGLLAAEAYHASMIRGALYRKGLSTASLRTNTDKFAAAMNTLDGSSDAQGISPTTPSDGSGTAANITPTDTSGICWSRSTGQVLNILLLDTLDGTEATKGGFFPNGLNGTITASASTTDSTSNA